MNFFRCYSCWRSLGYSGPKDHLVCSRCDTKLMVTPSPTGTVSSQSLRDLDALMIKLREKLSQIHEIYRGNCEPIAGPDFNFTPDAIYYERGEIAMVKPIIYSIITCDAFDSETTIAKYRLFSETTQNLFSQLYLVVPLECLGKSGEESVLMMLKTNNINTQTVRIIAL